MMVYLAALQTIIPHGNYNTCVGISSRRCDLTSPPLFLVFSDNCELCIFSDTVNYSMLESSMLTDSAWVWCQLTVSLFWLSLWYIPHSDGLGDTLLKGSVLDTMVAFPCNDLLYMRCRLNAFNCCPDRGARFVATEQLSSNGRFIIGLLGAMPQYITFWSLMTNSQPGGTGILAPMLRYV
jgi:hypothetical protein